MSKKAVLIGCNYSSIPNARLSGCINDIVNVRGMLIDAYGYAPNNIVLLRDDTTLPSTLPTRANILAALTKLFAQSGPNDELFVHYSGHGTQVKDTDGDELAVDGMDEAIVPCDFPNAGFITDDTLYSLLKTAHPKSTLFCCFDSCHSGTVLDLPFSYNYNATTGTSTLSNNGLTPINKPSALPNNVFMFSGCRDAQTSADSFSNLEKLPVGAFTDAFIESLRAANHSIGMVALHCAICQRLRTTGYSQIPVLSASSSTTTFSFQRFSLPSASASSSSSSLTVTPTSSNPIIKPTTATATTTTNSVKGIFSFVIDQRSGKSIPSSPPLAHLEKAKSMMQKQ